MKYIATLRVDGKEFLVLPKTRKRNTFASVESAFKALERAWQNQPIDAVGVVKNMNGEIVTNVLL